MWWHCKQRWAGAQALSTLALLILGGAQNSQAASLRYCDRQLPMSIAQQDQIFRIAGIVKERLEQSGQPLALISRSGLDLGRFNIRYSHAALSLKDSDNGAWSARQLYYACEEQAPRIFDQGLSGFLLGTEDPEIGYLSIVFLPTPQAQPLAEAAMSKPRVLQLLNSHYSANAYAYSLQYQNCNQWVMELMATAWGPFDDTQPARPQAQAWLQAQQYEPSLIDVQYRALMWLSYLVPWLHSSDHPAPDLAHKRFRIHMPGSIESFVRQYALGAQRLEICHKGARVVIHHGWDMIAEGCEPGSGDEVLMLD